MVAITLILVLIQYNFGHLLVYYLLDAASNSGVASGVQITEEGLSAALRLDAAGIVLALQMTWGELGAFVLESVLVFLISVPVLYGALGHFLGLLHRRSADLKSLFSWYTDLRLTLRSMGLELILSAVTWVVRVAGMVPGLALFAATINAAEGTFAARLSNLSPIVLLAGILAAYFLSCQLEPARYFLAADPSLGVLGALRTGRVDYFWFSLSFIGWEFFSTFTYGLGDIYLLPYRSLSTILYLGIVDPNQFQNQQEVPRNV